MRYITAKSTANVNAPFSKLYINAFRNQNGKAAVENWFLLDALVCLCFSSTCQIYFGMQTGSLRRTWQAHLYCHASCQVLKNRVYLLTSQEPGGVCAYLYFGTCANDFFVAFQILLTRVYLLGSRCHKMQNRIWNELAQQQGKRWHSIS